MNLNQFRTITHVIYDMDGLLLDTEKFYTEVTQEIVGRYGHVFDWSVKSQMMGRKALESAKILIDTYQLPFTPQALLEERQSLLEALFPQAEMLPGVMELTTHLKQSEVKQAIATSSSQRMFDLKMQQHQEWLGVFDFIVMGDDPAVKEGKPAPDIFLAAAQRLNADPKNCLVFEDAPAGMEAAIAAGMAVVVVPDANMNHEAYPLAHQILDSLEAFEPQLWGLPPKE